jgi:hypothetical protein
MPALGCRVQCGVNSSDKSSSKFVQKNQRCGTNFGN